MPLALMALELGNLLGLRIHEIEQKTNLLSISVCDLAPIAAGKNKSLAALA